MREQSLEDRIHRLHSLLELGQMIGLDLKLDDMLLQIARKACELMESDRCTLFLHDPQAGELWSKVALGMEGQTIRIPDGAGIAGHCFRTGESVHLPDAYADPRFRRETDERTGYRTKNLFCTPIHNRDGARIGVIQLLNRHSDQFTGEDEACLRIFSNHASIFIEIAQLQQARIDALEQTKKGMERLNRAKNKALDHLSHELKTPLSVIRGYVNLLRKPPSGPPASARTTALYDAMDRNLNRILAIQEATDDIIRSYQELEHRCAGGPDTRKVATRAEPISLLPFAAEILEKVRERSVHRDLRFELEVAADHCVSLDPRILEEVLVGLLKNAVENTPDEGTVRVVSERKDGRVLLKVHDFGVGITEDNQRSIFDGLFHTLDTDLYTSGRPYDFNAGGKGLDLLKMKLCSQEFGFDLSLESTRCQRLPTDRDLCPGRISSCPRCRGPGDCQSSGGTTFCVSFAAAT